MLVFALLFAALGALGAYVGLGGINATFGQFGEFSFKHYGLGLALNSFALAAYFAYFWLQRTRRRSF